MKTKRANKYWFNALIVKNNIIEFVETILKVYGNELTLKMEEYNLLENDDNCIESSTAIGYLLEEFIVTKLEIFTKNEKFEIKRNSDGIKKKSVGTTQNSYDCFTMFKNEKYLINIKANKNNNNAIAAITKLYQNYIEKDENNLDIIKHYFILKLNYKIKKNENDNIKKIIINGVEGFYLEEINFEINGHKQDNRSWSKMVNANSGRMQISKSFYDENRMNEEDISYEKTKIMISKIFENNKNKK